MAITPVFCCGLECGITTSAHWLLGGGTISFSTSRVRSGARSLRSNPTAAGGSIAVATLSSASARRVGRVYVWWDTLPNGSVHILTYSGISAAGPGVRFNVTDSKLYASIGATLGASGVTITTGQWYRIDFDFNMQVAGNDFCDVQVNDVACGQATATGLSATDAGITMGHAGAVTADAYFDDFILSDTSADYPIGDGYVNHFIPTSDGTHNVAGANDFERTLTGTDIIVGTTTAYQLVDDVPLESGASVDWINMIAPVNATDYVECIFGPAPGISVPTTAPRAVEVIAGIHQTDTGTGNMEIRLNDNGSMGTIYTATTVAGVATIVYKRAHFADPPSAATAWNVNNDGSDGDFRDLRVRFGSPAALDVVPDQYFDCIMIEAEFAPTLSPDAYGRPAGQIGQRQMQQLLAT